VHGFLKGLITNEKCNSKALDYCIIRENFARSPSSAFSHEYNLDSMKVQENVLLRGVITMTINTLYLASTLYTVYIVLDDKC
jgi:hypothetical protein